MTRHAWHAAGDEAAAEAPAKKPRKGKNPKVDTSFLPDADRDRAMQLERERLKVEWLKEQERIKREWHACAHAAVPCAVTPRLNSSVSVESLEVTYSYWDGSGHRRTIVVRAS